MITVPILGDVQAEVGCGVNLREVSWQSSNPSRTRLEKVLASTRPYADLDSKTQAAAKMRKRIVSVSAGTMGSRSRSTTKTPNQPQEVTNRLVRLCIEETIKARRNSSRGRRFLVTPLRDARTELENKDAALRRYKRERLGRLPEQLHTNLATMQNA